MSTRFTYIEHHIQILQIRKRDALAGTIIMGILFIIASLFGAAMAWSAKGEPANFMLIFLTVMTIIDSALIFNIQAGKYHILKEMIELLQVIREEMDQHIPREGSI